MPEAAELEKTPKKAAKPKTLKAYVLNKSLIGYGVINGVINGLVAYLINMGNPSGYFEWTNVLLDFAITGLLLGAILAACVLPMTRKDVRNGIVILPTALTGWRTRMPKGTAATIIFCGVVGAVLMPLVGVIVPLVFGPMSLMGFVFYKGVFCALLGALMGCLCIYKVIAESIK